MKYSRFLFLCVFLTHSLFAQDFKILTSDEHSIEVEFVLPRIEMTRVLGADGIEYQRFKMDHLAKMAQGGYPELPFFATLFQVPPDGEIQVEVLDQQTDTMQISSLYPVPKPILSENKEIVEQFIKSAQAYQATDFYPKQLIKVDQRALLREVPVVRVNLYPFQWQAKTGTLRYASSLRFKLHFSHPLPLEDKKNSSDHYEQFLRQVIQGYRPQAFPRESRQVIPQGPKHTTVQFKINKSGIYQLSYETLQASGVPETCLSQGQLVLYDRTQQVIPWKVKNSRSFGKGDALEFYAQSFEDIYADTNIYRLECWEIFPSYGTQFFSKRSLLVKGTPTSTNQPLSSFQKTLRFEENKGVWLETPYSPNKDYWFWKRMKAPDSVEIPLSVPHPLESTEQVSLTLAFQGETVVSNAKEHHIDVYLNNSLLGQVVFGEQEDKSETFQLPSNLLVEENTLRLSFPESEQTKNEVLYFNWVEISYLRQLALDKNELEFSLLDEGRKSIKLTHAASSDLRIFDITDPSHVREVTDFSITPEGDTFQAIFEDDFQSTTPKTYYATTISSSVESVELLPSPLLRQSTQQADYLIITPRKFLSAVEPLLQYRENQGLHSKSIAIEDIYSEFGFGFSTPHALKAFLSYTYYHWQPPVPRYVLLFGDSTLDYKGQLSVSKNKASLLPPYLIETLFGVTPDDNWFVSVAGDDPLPDMMIGRLPGGKESDISELVNKIIGYESAPQDYHDVLFVTDDGFEKISDKMQKRYFADIPVNKLYLKEYKKEELDQLKTSLIEYLNKGQLITQYIGHGNMSLWAKEEIFNKSSIKSLTNQNKLTWVLALSCLNGYFAAPGQYALGEELVRATDKGAFAVFSSSGYGYSGSYEMITDELFSRIFEQHQTPRLGELITQSKIAIYGKGADEESLSVFTLLGDPASVLHTP